MFFAGVVRGALQALRGVVWFCAILGVESLRAGDLLVNSTALGADSLAIQPRGHSRAGFSLEEREKAALAIRAVLGLKGDTTLRVDAAGLWDTSLVLRPSLTAIRDDKVGVQPYPPTCHGERTGTIYATTKGGESATFILLDHSTLRFIATNGNGLFTNLPAGSYALWANFANGDQFRSSAPIVLEDPDAITIGFTPFGDFPKCAGETLERLQAKAEGGTEPFLHFAWSFRPYGQTEDRPLPSGTPEEVGTLYDVLPGRYSLRVGDSNGCNASSIYYLPGASPVEFDHLPNLSVRCRAFEQARFTYTPTLLKGGLAPYTAVWNSSIGDAIAKGDTLRDGHQYTLTGGKWPIKVTDSLGCQAVLEVEVKHGTDDVLDYHFADPGQAICYGARNIPVELITSNEALVAQVKWSVKMGVGTDNPQPGAFDPSGKTRITVKNPIYTLTAVNFDLTTTYGCRDTATLFLSPQNNIGLEFDRLGSKVGVLHVGRDAVDRQRTPLNAPPSQVVYKDSVLLGVLADVPSDIAFKTQVPAGSLSFSFVPAGLFQPSDDGLPGHFSVLLPQGALENSEFSSALREVDKGGKKFRVLRAKIRAKGTGDGCEDETEIYLRIVDQLRIPNVFTPNDDGMNDRWLRNGDPSYDNLFSGLSNLLPKMEVEVFTRAGVQVWHAKGEAISQGWDGKSGGAPLPVGTYYYVIRFNVPSRGSAWKPIAGSVTIVR